MSPRTSTGGRTADSSAESAIDLLGSLRKPFKALGLLIPGVRGKILYRIGRAESVLQEAVSSEEALASVVNVGDQMREDVAANRQAMEKLARIHENRSVQDQITHKSVGDKLQSIVEIADGNLRLTEREDAVKQREAFARETGARLQTLLESTNRRQEEMQSLLREANALFSAVQALQEQLKQRQRDVEEQAAANARAAAEQTKALDERSKRLEAHKVQLQTREQLLQQSENRLATTERQRGALEEEIVQLKKQRAAEVAKGEELVRDRERAIVKREEEVGAISLLMQERERAIQERENVIKAREAERTRMEATIEALKTQIAEKERQAVAMDQAIKGLTEHGHELQQLLSGLSARL